MKKNRKRAGPTPFAKILRALMAEKHLTVREAARIAGVGPSTVDDWRAGAVPEDYFAVKRLAQHLGVTLTFILTGEEDDRDREKIPAVAEVFSDGGHIFDGFAKITIQRLLPKKEEVK